MGYNPKSLKTFLNKVGVSENMPSLNDIVGEFTRKSYIAICDSNECSRQAKSKKVRKHVSRNTKSCPDCGHGLFWKEDK